MLKSAVSNRKVYIHVVCSDFHFLAMRSTYWWAVSHSCLTFLAPSEFDRGGHGRACIVFGGGSPVSSKCIQTCFNVKCFTYINTSVYHKLYINNVGWFNAQRYYLQPWTVLGFTSRRARFYVSGAATYLFPLFLSVSTNNGIPSRGIVSYYTIKYGIGIESCNISSSMSCYCHRCMGQ